MKYLDEIIFDLQMIEAHPPSEYVVIDESESRIDPLHLVTSRVITSNPTAFAQALSFRVISQWNNRGLLLPLSQLESDYLWILRHANRVVSKEVGFTSF